MISVIRQIYRGCGDLPYVGEHPGWPVLMFFICVGGIVGGERGGFTGALLGIFAIVVPMVPLFLTGAYERAELSDALIAHEEIAAAAKNSKPID